MTAAWFLFTLYKLARCKPDVHPHPAELFKQPPLAKTTSVITGDNSNVNDPCLAEYNRVTADRTSGLTADDLERSRAYAGNRQRLATVAHKLIAQQKPLHIVVCGGSISLGHGVTPETARYSGRLHEWLKQYYPLPAEENQQHLVTSMAAHGADVRFWKFFVIALRSFFERTSTDMTKSSPSAHFSTDVRHGEANESTRPQNATRPVHSRVCRQRLPGTGS